MKIQHYSRLNDIPWVERYLDKLPVFATQEYANYLRKTSNHSTRWFYGIVNSDIQFLIPFAVKNKYFFTKGQFLTATIYLNNDINIETEREFLNSIVEIIKQEKLCDWIEQPPNWALFNVVPLNSIYCEFGTYRIDLKNNNENELFGKINKGTRRRIRNAISDNVIIKIGLEYLEDCIKVFSASSKQGNHTLPNDKEIKRILNYLPDKTYISTAYHNTIPQASTIIFSNKFCSYGIYFGVVANPSSSVGHLLVWQSIKDAKISGVKYFDFVGARINPTPGSKQEGIQSFKRHFGGELYKGFLWKMPINKFKYKFYELFVRTYFFLRGKKYGGDIIDQELKKVKR